MKTTGFRCETKLGLLVFLGHPNHHHQHQPHQHHQHLIVEHLDNLSKDVLLLLAPPLLATDAVLEQHVPRLGAHRAVGQLAERGQLKS